MYEPIYAGRLVIGHPAGVYAVRGSIILYVTKVDTRGGGGPRKKIAKLLQPAAAAPGRSARPGGMLEQERIAVCGGCTS